MNYHTIKNPKELYRHQGAKFYAPIAMIFVSLFLVTNIISQKIIPLGHGIILTAGDFIYPLNYILSILLTEVYGYAMSRRVIWSAFLCNLIVAIIIMGAIALPAANSWTDQNQYAAILGKTPRFLAASFSAFLVGEFIGTYTLAKIKIATAGKYLWLRTISATAIGQFIDSISFTTIAFIGIVSWSDIYTLGFLAYWGKILFQIIATPGIYGLAKFLKTHEHIDIFDKNTNFNPFNLGIK